MLTPEQQADAKRLRQLWDERHGHLSQQAFGEKYDLGDQGNVTQYLNGYIPLNLAAGIKFAHALMVPVSEISPTLGEITKLVNPKLEHKKIFEFWDRYQSLEPEMRHVVDAAMWGKV